ncbi:MAG: hypothetical protein WCG25_06225 [bacterium]
MIFFHALKNSSSGFSFISWALFQVSPSQSFQSSQSSSLPLFFSSISFNFFFSFITSISFSSFFTFSGLIFFLSKDASHSVYIRSSLPILFPSKFIDFPSSDISSAKIYFKALLSIKSLLSPDILISKSIGNLLSAKLFISEKFLFSHHLNFLLIHSLISHQVQGIVTSFLSISKISFTNQSKLL